MAVNAVNMEAERAGVLLMGRALHAPWNEGTRVIARNLASVARLLRPVHVVSLTHTEFMSQGQGAAGVKHVYTGAHYGMASDYAGLGRVIEGAQSVIGGHRVGVAHLVGAPLALAPWLRYRGIRVVNHVTLCEQVYMGAVERLRAFLGWRLFDRWVDAHAVSSGALVEPLTLRGIDRDKIVMVPAPIDTGTYHPDGRDESRLKLGFEEGDAVVVYVGTLSPVRFPAEIVRAGLRQAAEQWGRPIRFFAFAPQATHGYNRAWSEEARAHLEGIPGVAASVTLGDLQERDKAHWFRAADAVLLPFTAPVAVEPPLTMLEAMACGAPVIATPHANRSRAIESGANGFLYENVHEMAVALAMALEAGDEIKVMKRKARRSVVEQYSFATSAAAVASLWQRLEGGRR